MCADFSLKMHQKRLAVRFRPDPGPAGELSAVVEGYRQGQEKGKRKRWGG